MKKPQIFLFRSLILAVLFYVTLMLPQAKAGATEVVTVEGVSYNVNANFVDNLKSLTGKKVYITLDSGTILAGNVKTVGDHLLHLEKLDGKEYFDALIIIEKIIAIDTRFRTLKR